MPRFFFDTHDTVRSVRDEHGSELVNLDAAKRLAGKALCEMMADNANALETARYSAVVRDQVGTELFTAHLTLSLRPAK